ncbi:hypothetical protein D1646_14500 [Pseudoflavonifractor sp. 60]|uniref:hypothetical protein n=1 Tax=Pseudoflavonifractor sp. 60 TaxID=2304576 RepID=UPI00136F9193|nr:hypothetical protein [Pseudoflavonifractor sp. 60]NBI67989.1 hypothetical protein [Pseudoflavonifractor sp. 60]
MREKILERAFQGWGLLKRFGISSLWLAAVQTLSCLACAVVVNGLFSRDFQWEWLVYVLGLAMPVLWGIGGRALPDKFRPRGSWEIWSFLLLWTFLPGILCCWADLGGADILWVVLYPQMMARMAWFYPLFDGPQPAHVLNNLQPLAAAGTHVLMMAGFSIGMCARRKKKK